MNENVLNVTLEDFDSIVLHSDIPVLIDFWADWCGPCKMIGPTIDVLADEYAGKAKVGKVNVDEQQQLAVKYGVMTIPTIILFNKGEIIEEIVGVRPKAELAGLIDKHIN